MKFVGIDLAWKRRGGTAVVVLDGGGRFVAHGYEKTDRAIASFVEQYCKEGCLIGIDAPLVVNNFAGRRGCEDKLQEMGIPAYPANRSWFLRAFGTVRGESLLAELEEKGMYLVDAIPSGRETRGVMEVYPYATLRMILPKIPSYKKGRKKERTAGVMGLLSMLQRCKPPLHIPLKLLRLRETMQLKRASDFIDAAIAAYTVYICFRDPEACLILGDKREGFVLLPKKP